MEKEQNLAQGKYIIGIDFPEGTFIFRSLNKDILSTICFTSKTYEEDACDVYYLDEDNTLECRLNLINGDAIELSGKIAARKAEMITFS